MICARLVLSLVMLARIASTNSLRMPRMRYKGSVLNMSSSAFEPRSSSILAVHVKGRLIPGSEAVANFYENTVMNAKNSILETGVSRFDLLRGLDCPEEFLLIEIYKESEAPAAHKETQHYKTWREAVEPLMAVPRAAVKYHTVYPFVSVPEQEEEKGDGSSDRNGAGLRSIAWDATKNSGDVSIVQHTTAYPWDAAPYSTCSATRGGLLAVLVDVQVAPGKELEFMRYTIENCANSVQESGVHRFDLLRNAEDPSNFLLVEIYNSEAAPAAHKQTAHYARWAASVKDMMARPRAASKYVTLFPKPLHFHKPSALIFPGEGAAFYKEQRQLEIQIQQQQRAAGSEGAAAGMDGGMDDWGGRKGLSTAFPQMFGFQCPRVVMGRGVAGRALKDAIKTLSVSRPLIVTGSSGLARHSALLDDIFSASAEGGEGVAAACHSYSDDSSNSSYSYRDCVVAVCGEPTVEDAQAATETAKARRCDSVIAIGGGSAIDLGKAVAALINNSERDIYDYLEVIGKGMPIEHAPVPFIAVPTTSGTGSEATKNAVLKSNKFKRKVSIRHESMLPDVAVLDPTLTLSCPAEVSAHVGMDALCQLIEPFCSNVPNVFVDALAREGIQRAARSLRDVVVAGSSSISNSNSTSSNSSSSNNSSGRSGSSGSAVVGMRELEAREDLAVASLFGGICLANSKLGAVHGFAAVLGGMYESAPHGAVCAALLPYVFEKNVQRLSEIANRQTRTNAETEAEMEERLDAVVRLARFQEVSRLVTGSPSASIAEGVAWLHALLRDIEIPPLSVLCRADAAAGGEGGDGGISEKDFGDIVVATQQASSTKGNPVQLSADDLLEVLTKAM